jgi:hypothetical protein
MRYLNALASAKTDGAILTGNGKNRNGTALFLSVAFLFCLLAGSAHAAAPAPGWTIDSVAAPTNFSVQGNEECRAHFEYEPGQSQDCDAYKVFIVNTGAKQTDGSPVTIEDTLPEGVTEKGIVLVSFPSGGIQGESLASQACKVVGRLVSCVLPEENGLSAVEPDGTLELVVNVTVNESQPRALTNTVTVSGGGAPEASASRENQVSSSPPPFGIAAFTGSALDAAGAVDTQAGDHPYELTTTIDLNTAFSTKYFTGQPLVTSVQDLRDVVVDLPLGFAGSTLAAPQCTLAQFSSAKKGGPRGEPLPGTGCPRETTVGHIFTEPGVATQINSPIWNLTPEHGVPGEFGFIDVAENTHVFFVHVVPTPEGYVLRAVSPEIAQTTLSHIVVSVYGNPAARDQSNHAQVPFFTDPTNCSGGNLKATIWVDSWQNPGTHNPDGTPTNLEAPGSNWVKATSESPPVIGCDLLQFTPELLAQPTTHQADTPSGLEFELKLPQTEQPAVPATPALRNATVVLPEGMTVDPSSGNGLQACSVAQIGWLGGSPFNFNASPPACPEASKIGTLELETPLIPGVLTGAIYLAAQNENPFGSTLAAYVVVNDPVTGVVLKIPGEIKANPGTGQLTTYFPENAQLPFSDLKLHFFSGPRASLATPESCGTFTTTSDLEPWSAPDSGPNATPFDSFQIDEGCVNRFAPKFTALSTNVQAGAFTPFVASFSRGDADQELGGLTLTMPPGLEAVIAGVPECPEAQANAGTCPESTQIGTVQAQAGPGPNPLSVTGKAYFTGPYNGGAFGLSVVVPAIAGPYNFGNVIVRQSLRVNPLTAQITDVSDPFPTILDPVGANGQTSGIPIKLRRVDVTINRPNFTFNPTNCSKLQVAGTITSAQGASSALATPFQVTNCATLKFQPKVSVTTAAHSSKANGASLVFKISYPKGAMGSQSWFNEAKFDLPKQLPARLTTIQKACLAATFEHNRGACPAASIIGHAVVHTPVLPVALEGPVYFVSYGGAAFPDAVLVLDGYGVHIELHGNTFINGKTSITSATFRNTPDVPFESIEVTIPSGKFGEFGANLPASAKGSFCGQKLVMPTLFKAQNGLEIHQNTAVGVTGCAKAKTRAQLYAAALKACHRDKNKAKRKRCEATAHRKYAPLKKKK